MKVNGRFAVSVLAMIVTFILVLGFQVEAAQYLGQVTWTWHKTRDEKGPTDKYETFTLGLFFIGGSYYELSGSGSDPDSGTTYVSGGAIVEGNNLIMTLKKGNDRSDGTQEVGIFKGQVDKTTLSNGSGWTIKKRFDPVSNTFIDKYAAGTLTIVGSPVPLRPMALAPMHLLMNE
ncbi:MAG: hypothetical protein ACYDIC_13545 [Desulfobaccales bacterium]